MAVQYRLYQDKREKSTTSGKWYARTVYGETMKTDDLISLIEKVCTVSDADVVAVMKALQFVVCEQLGNGRKVHLDGLGTFYVAIQTKPANSAKEFTQQQNIVGARLRFLAERRKNRQANTYYAPLLQKVTFSELRNYFVDKEDDEPTPETGE